MVLPMSSCAYRRDYTVLLYYVYGWAAHTCTVYEHVWLLDAHDFSKKNNQTKLNNSEYHNILQYCMRASYKTHLFYW